MLLVVYSQQECCAGVYAYCHGFEHNILPKTFTFFTAGRISPISLLASSAFAHGPEDKDTHLSRAFAAAASCL